MTKYCEECECWNAATEECEYPKGCKYPVQTDYAYYNSDDTDCCFICGAAADPKFFWDGRHHCSSAHKWKDMWMTECSKEGIRPTMLNAWEEVKHAVSMRQGNRCAICRQKVLSTQEFHHIKPLFMGGNSMPDNVIMLCHECHQDLHHGVNRKRRIHGVIDINKTTDCINRRLDTFEDNENE